MVTVEEVGSYGYCSVIYYIACATDLNFPSEF